MVATPDIHLLEHPLSPYAQKLKIALAEKGLAFTVETPGAIGSGRTPEAFRRDNYRGEVPVLHVEGRALYDSSIILEFLEDRFPEPPLLPQDSFARARARTIEEVCDTTYEAITWGLSEVHNFRRADGALADTLSQAAARQIGRLNAWLESELGGADWFGGHRFGWADACAAPFVQGATGFGLETPRALSAWLERCRDRPSVAPVFQAARAAASAMAEVAGVVESGLFKRQYRDHRLEWMIRSGGIDVVRRGLERDDIRFNGEPAPAT